MKVSELTTSVSSAWEAKLFKKDIKIFFQLSYSALTAYPNNQQLKGKWIESKRCSTSGYLKNKSQEQTSEKGKQ